MTAIEILQETRKQGIDYLMNGYNNYCSSYGNGRPWVMADFALASALGFSGATDWTSMHNRLGKCNRDEVFDQAIYKLQQDSL